MKTPSSVDVQVGVRVRLRRVELGLSQTNLGERLGITFQQIQKYEKGTNRIGASRLQAIAQALNVPVGYFFGPMHGDETGETGATEILSLLSAAGAVELLRDFSRITSREGRRAVAMVAKALAGHADEPPRKPTAGH